MGIENRSVGTITIERLYISPEHNYVGHKGQPAGTQPHFEVSEIACVAGSGIREDRYFDHQPDYKGQITFFSSEVFQLMKRELGLDSADAGSSRRNVLISGVDLNQWIGKEFELQEVRFFGVEECRPCAWMDQAFAPGAHLWLMGRGGLRARILTDGTLKLG